MLYVDFAPGRGPEPTETETEIEAQAAIRGPAIGSPAAVPSPFTNTARNISGLLADGWENETICWDAQACIKTECDDDPCPDGNCPPAELDETGLTGYQSINGCASCKPFTFGTKFNWDNCRQPELNARQVVDASAGKNLSRKLHSKLMELGNDANGGKCVCAETAVGLLEQAWEANHTGQAWYSVPSMLKGHLVSSGLLRPVGARWELCGQPAIVGGMGPQGPVGSDPVTDCAYLWIHGPVDYALGRVVDKSFPHDTGNKGFANVRRYGLVRVDPCGIGGVPVSLKCGGC